MKESAIRPDKLFQQYLKLARDDAERLFVSTRAVISCVFCCVSYDEEKGQHFEKSGFQYNYCQSCGSLFNSPRPQFSEFEAFYLSSESSRFWEEVFFPEVLEARREVIFKRRATQLDKLLKKYDVDIRQTADIGAGFGLFLDEWHSIRPECQRIAVEPSHEMAEICRAKGIDIVIENVVEKVDDETFDADLIVCFEVLEHVHSPKQFLAAIANLCKPSGHLVLSTLCIEGFDLSVLKDKSDSIAPPHHINFGSRKVFEVLLESVGFKLKHFETPGILDVEIVGNKLRKGDISDAEIGFIAQIYGADKTSVDRDNFQRFLSDSKLSSHCWLLAEKE